MKIKFFDIGQKNAVSDCLVIFMFIMTFISSLAIYASDTTLSDDMTQGILRAVVYGCVTICFFLIFLKNINNLHIPIAVVIPVISILVFYFDSYVDPKFNGLLMLELVFYFFLDNAEKKKLYLMFKNFLYIISIIGVVIYVCSVIGISLPHKTVPYYGSHSMFTTYQNYGLAYLCVKGDVCRLCGLFNEPGYFGTMLALVLCIERLNMRKKENIVFFIAGFFTFSVAFFLIVILYAVLVNIHNYKYFVLILFFVLFYLFVLPNIQFSNTSLNRLVERLTFQDGQLAGDNRSNYITDFFYYSVLQSPKKIIWGYGSGFASFLHTGALSYKNYIINFGLVGFALIYIPLLIEALRKARLKRECVIFVICFFSSIYQRPNIYTLPYFVVLFGGIAYLYQMKTQIFIERKIC